MAKHLESYYLKQDMRDDLMRCYREVAPTCITQYGAWRKTVNHPAKRYYVTPRHAAEIISYYLRGKKEAIEGMKHYRRLMYRSILAEVQRLMALPEYHSKPLIDLVRTVVTKPAPSFFLCPEYMAVIFSRIKFKHYDADGRLTCDFPSDKINYNERYRQRKLKKQQQNNGTEHQPTHSNP